MSYKYSGCSNLTSVVSLIENPFSIAGKNSDNSTFDLDVFNNVSLYVPVGTIDKYKATAGWKDFWFIEESTGGAPPTPEQCATPTITYYNGKVRFTCETEGVEFVPTVTCTPRKLQNGNEMEIGGTFTISVYATKDGYDDSDLATMTVNISQMGDVDADGHISISDVTSLVNLLLGK